MSLELGALEFSSGAVYSTHVAPRRGQAPCARPARKGHIYLSIYVRTYIYIRARTVWVRVHCCTEAGAPWEGQGCRQNLPLFLQGKERKKKKKKEKKKRKEKKKICCGVPS